MTYQEFLETKIELAQDSGFVVAPEKINQVLKPHQRDAVAWALKGGRRALFESFGLGKTVQELENVEEFKTWGPLNRSHRPIKAKQGVTFKKFVSQLQNLGYQVEFSELVAADYGAPTMRKRFFMIARCERLRSICAAAWRMRM